MGRGNGVAVGGVMSRGVPSVRMGIESEGLSCGRPSGLGCDMMNKEWLPSLRRDGTKEDGLSG